jgi:hypothetical protein
MLLVKIRLREGNDVRNRLLCNWEDSENHTVKVKFPLRLIKHHSMKTCVRVEA